MGNLSNSENDVLIDTKAFSYYNIFILALSNARINVLYSLKFM